jgi:hypothetical protein
MAETSLLSRNARVLLEVSCGLKAGESVLFLTRRTGTKYFSGEKMALYIGALVAEAAAMGALPAVVDVSEFLALPAYREAAGLPPLRAAMEAARVVVNGMDDVSFSRLVGSQGNDDEYLTARRRWVFLQGNGMEQWDLKADEVAAIRRRTERLKAMLDACRSIRVTSPAGTDITFAMGPQASCKPILGIVPLYGEVAVSPPGGSGDGVIVVDGPTQQKVRPASELDRPPLRIVVKGGRATEYSGDATQVSRLKAFIASGTPAADAIDEVGIPTTRIPENDRFWWSDGTHHGRRIHIALGNNLQDRATRVHGARHMDTESDRPSLFLDGREVLREGEFLADLT